MASSSSVESGSGDGQDQVKYWEQKFTIILGPYEPIIMHAQSLLVWEYPWKSSALFIFFHILFWFICTTSSRFFFLLSLTVMLVVFIDTWKNRIWPEIRVPPKEPEDKDGWTPVHLRLLSVPEISTHLSQATFYSIKTFTQLRLYRISHPLIFCLGSTLFFACTACIGSYISGFMLGYITIMSFMLWPSVLYHSLLRKLYLKLEPSFMWLDYKMRNTCRSVYTLGGRISVGQSQQQIPHVEVIGEDEFFPQVDPELVAALAKAITDSEEEGGHSTIPTPMISINPSLNNTEDENSDDNDFEEGMDRMPSFDDNLENTDDDLDDLPLISTPSNPPSKRLSQVLRGATPHFGDTDSEDDLTKDLDFKDTNRNSSSSEQGVSGGGLLATAAAAVIQGGSGAGGLPSMAGALVAQTFSSMVESAMQGVASLSQGQTASASSLMPRTGKKMTYTRSKSGESIDFSNPEPTIAESDNEMDEEEEEEEDEDATYEGDEDDVDHDDDDEREGDHVFDNTDGESRLGRGRISEDEATDGSDQIAEIERDFDFLRELDSDEDVADK